MFGFGADAIFSIPALLVALTVHEYAHARAALAFGDYTAKAAGRVTLNPLPHLDPFGLLMLWLAGFGWAKPVPINPYNFRNGRMGVILVSLAGVAANFAVALAAALLINYLVVAHITQYELMRVLQQMIRLNLALAVFNLIPLPPLDGAQVISSLLPPKYAYNYEKIAPYGPFILMGLVIAGFIGYVVSPFYIALASTIDFIIRLIF